MNRMKAKDFMIEDVYSARPEDTVVEVLKLLVDKRVGGLPIVDEQNRLVGVVSDGDILRSLKPEKEHYYFALIYSVYVGEIEVQSILNEMKTIPIRNIAKKKQIVTVSPDTALEEIIRIFSAHHFKKLPVVDKENKVIGIISRGDVLRHIRQAIVDKIE